MEDSIIFIFMGIGIVITLIIIGSVVGSMNKKELKESITSLPKQQDKYIFSDDDSPNVLLENKIFIDYCDYKND